ncbi:type IV pilin [Halorubrum halophilum]|uniref:type IV pilin n=1 Tax=Halorubrum halophilum TaxID=413816 RepID=UPI0009E3F6D5|nr:type IV pilin [Halorubrum halophilum]
MSAPSSSRAVSSVIATVLMVAIVVILAATISVYGLGFADDITRPGPLVGQSSGELVSQDGNDGGIVRIRHIAGDTVQVRNMEIVVDATEACGKQSRLVGLPATSGNSISDSNIEGDDIFDEGSYNSDRTPDKNAIHRSEYATGDEIAFRIPSTDCSIDRGEEIEVRVVHTPTNSVIITQTLTVT